MLKNPKPEDIKIAERVITYQTSLSPPPYSLYHQPAELIQAENKYKNDKFKKLNPGGQAKEEKDSRFFSSDPEKDRIMKAYWEPLKKGFERTAAIPEVVKKWDLEAAEPYLKVIIQRYYAMQKGQFEVFGASTINNIEREFLAKNFGVKLPEKVERNESWNTFVGKIGADKDELSWLQRMLRDYPPPVLPPEKPSFIHRLSVFFTSPAVPSGEQKTEVSTTASVPAAVGASLPDIDVVRPEGYERNFRQYPMQLIEAENKYKNQEVHKWQGSARDINDYQIMKKYWEPLKQSFEQAPRRFPSHVEDCPYIAVIIQRYYEMQRGRDSSNPINLFERQYLDETQFDILIPGMVGKDETWQTFVSKIILRTGYGRGSSDSLQEWLRSNPPLSERPAAAASPPAPEEPEEEEQFEEEKEKPKSTTVVHDEISLADELEKHLADLEKTAAKDTEEEQQRAKTQTSTTLPFPKGPGSGSRS